MDPSYDEAAGDEDYNHILNNQDNLDQGMVGVDIIKAMDGHNSIPWKIMPQFLPLLSLRTLPRILF